MPSCLIFDEMPVVRKIAERIITNAGYETQVFDKPADLDARLRDGALPDLAILSATGGHLNMLDRVRQIRQRDGNARTVVLVSLVERNVGMLMRVRRAGANGVLMKPFDARSFLDTLDFCIKGAKAAA